MRRIVVWLFMVALIALALVYYGRKHSPGGLDVDPHAGREIEKAKRQ